jgi:prepilin-type processing-associated H-X9-DG protein
MAQALKGFHCSVLETTVDVAHPSVERGGQGYGYNLYIGTLAYLVNNPNTAEAYERGVKAVDVSAPDSTVMFSDTAMNVSSSGAISFSAASGVLAEYSICDAPFGVMAKKTLLVIRNEPSIHFRHDALANVVWCDGHADSKCCEWTLDEKWREKRLGFFGSSTDNSIFDLD